MSLRDTTVIPKKAEEASAPRPACLVQIFGRELGRRYILDGELTAGRDDSNDIVLDLDTVSRQHARFFYQSEAYSVVDLGSTNGTYVNDIRIENETTLKGGDLVKIGGIVFKFLSGDETEAHYHEELYRKAIFDGLTGIHNKRYFFDFLEKEMARSTRYGGELTLVLIDIDHFKEINDTFGHLAGDFVLEQIARLIDGRMRREALLARYGGEEFALVLPEIDLSRAVVFCERLRAQVETHAFVFEDHEIRVTISAGVASIGGRAKPPEFIKAADEQLYLAKRRGRNRVEFELSSSGAPPSSAVT